MMKFCFYCPSLILGLFYFISIPSLSAQSKDYSHLYQLTDVTHYVDPLIGTEGEGYVYPGATSPWGMVSASPHTTYTSRLGYITGKVIAPAGYYYGQPKIEGFGQTHLSGVACPALGAPVIAVNTGKFDPNNYASAYSEEIAKAGFYAVNIDDMKTRVSITTTPRAAYYQFEFQGDEPNYILIDAYKNLSWGDHDGFMEQLDDESFAGWSQTGNFCGQGNTQKVFFYLKVKSHSDGSGLWTSKGKVVHIDQVGGHVGAWIKYDSIKTVDLVIGVSYVSIENARENLEFEVGENDFETVLCNNINNWENELGKIRISDENTSKKTIFYTSLYHTLIHPNVISDVNGSYPLYESEGYGVNKENTRYGLFSMWDSYRNVHALLGLIYPEQQQDMLYSIEDMTLSSGHTPRWELHGSDVNLMVGDPALSILSEGFVKGFKFKNKEKLFDLLYKNAIDVNSTWRIGNAEY